MAKRLSINEAYDAGFADLAEAVRCAVARNKADQLPTERMDQYIADKMTILRDERTEAGELPGPVNTVCIFGEED